MRKAFYGGRVYFGKITMENYEKIKALLKEKGQEHLLSGYDLLGMREREELLKEISEIDWALLEEKPVERNGEIEPISALTSEEIRLRFREFEEAGAKLLRAGKIAAVMLAGGQGTRLGSSAPKGTFDIGITKPLYIFECQINNLLEVTRKYGARVPLLIMTSDKNDGATRDFLKKHAYFGYPQEDVYFFKQEMAPSTDLNGKILLESRGKLVLSPNGNGGWYSSVRRAGLDESMKARGVEWFNVFSVDNVLQRIADPVFLGATLSSGVPCGAKTVRKTSPEERVGVLCKRGGFPDIIEYYELDERTANARDEKGELLYGSGVTLNYLFRLSSLEEVAGRRIPVHRAKKKIPYFDGEETVAPTCENGYKYETLILDLIHLLKGCLPFEVEREREFAPVKNATGTDSADSARELLKKNGVEL